MGYCCLCMLVYDMLLYGNGDMVGGFVVFDNFLLIRNTKQ